MLWQFRTIVVKFQVLRRHQFGLRRISWGVNTGRRLGIRWCRSPIPSRQISPLRGTYPLIHRLVGTHKAWAIRLFYYPALKKDKSNGDRIRCGEHMDYSLFTWLYGTVPGLYVKPTALDSYIDLLPRRCLYARLESSWSGAWTMSGKATRIE